MRIPRVVANLAFIAWVMGTTYLPFVFPMWANVLWFAAGGLISWAWLKIPDAPEGPVEPLPFADQYKDRQVPRRGE